jgi:hypothetical protein
MVQEGEHMHGFHNLATPNIKLEHTMDIAVMNINNIKLNVDINIVATIQSQMKQRNRVSTIDIPNHALANVKNPSVA